MWAHAATVDTRRDILHLSGIARHMLNPSHRLSRDISMVQNCFFSVFARHLPQRAGGFLEAECAEICPPWLPQPPFRPSAPTQYVPVRRVRPQAPYMRKLQYVYRVACRVLWDSPHAVLLWDPGPPTLFLRGGGPGRGPPLYG